MVNGFQVTIDANNVNALVDFWALALGYVTQPPPPGFSSWPAWAAAEGIPEDQWDSRGALVDPRGTGPRLFFQRVPEEKIAKNRFHLDINAGGGADVERSERQRRVDEHVKQLVRAGGAVVREFNQEGERWIVMQDPEGNEFCVQ
ncbi:MAG: VOC family protein [Acidimicrobiia bacterium]|nr:VOC family protein [Acidimicrobiia bacterium]